jgi:D-alanyl-D-alanine carboxypeptidase
LFNLCKDNFKKHFQMKKLIFAIVLIGMLFSCSKNDEPAQTQNINYYDKPFSVNTANRLKIVLDSIATVQDIKGISCAVYVPNKGLWEQSFGFSHNNVTIKSTMAMPIGSNTKTYIAALILKLQENGKLNINDKVSNYLSLATVPYLTNDVTIKQLLNHKTGWGDFSFNPNFITEIFNNFNRVWQPNETFPFFEAPIGLPNTIYSYSDQNYLVAGLVIEAATNKSVAENMRTLILNPAGLSKTVYFPFEQTTLTIPHFWTAEFGTSFRDITVAGYSPVAFCSADNAAGGMFSTAKENVIFWDKLMNGKLINPTSLNLMKDCVPAPDNNNLYGLGIIKTINPTNGRVTFSHNGYIPGGINDNSYDAQSGICISILTNQDLKRDLVTIIAVLQKEALKIR